MKAKDGSVTFRGEGTKEAVNVCAYCGGEIHLHEMRRAYLAPENGKNVVKASMHERCWQEAYGDAGRMH
jgi:hypothetical protein